MQVTTPVHSEIKPNRRLAGIDIPAILITAFADDATHARVRALGATSVLGKPFEMSELVTLAHTVAHAARP